MGKLATFLIIPRKSVGSICERESKNKRKTGPKPKMNDRTGRKIIRFVQQKIDNNENVFALTVIRECNIPVSRITMQRHLHKCHYKFSNIRKRIVLTQTQKNARKEKCKN